MPDSPQNPYYSCIVDASAGTGKTYQLSKRFLSLVAAHADPAEILTITFTKKAAEEMRARVINSATNLATNKEAQDEFDFAMARYYQEFVSTGHPHLKPPKSAKEVGAEIFNQSQKLNIATMDSVFSTWLTSFASQGFDISYPFKIISADNEAEIKEHAWQKIWLSHQNKSPLLNLIQAGGLYEARRTVELLQKYSEQDSIEFLPHALPTAKDFSTIKAQIASLLPTYPGINTISTIEEAITAGILTKRKAITKSLFSTEEKKLREAQLKGLDNDIKEYIEHQKISKLNLKGSLYFALFEQFKETYYSAKKEKKYLDFSDLATTINQIFADDIGMFFYLQNRITHLMLDEFQDTSDLQWDIFQKISSELLAGENLSYAQKGIYSTVFIVGDAKQSIYGFRAANPKITKKARYDLSTFQPQLCKLQHSFRTARHVLNFVNTVFNGFSLPDFYQHLPAQKDGKDLVADFGEIVLTQMQTKTVQEEAEFVACYIEQALAKDSEFFVLEPEKRELQAGDFCILYRNATHADVFIEELAKKNINSQKLEEKGFFNNQEVKDILALCKWLTTLEDHHALLTVLRSPICDIEELEALEIYEKRHRDHNVHQVNIILESLATQHPDLVSSLQKVIKLRNEVPPHELLLFAIYQLDILSAYEQRFSGFVGTMAKNNIMKLIDLVIEFYNQGICSLAAMYTKLTEIATSDIIGTGNSSLEAVNLMTIHKAKGLEFPFVILVQAQDAWPKKDLYWAKIKKKNAVSYVGKKDEQPKNNHSFAVIHDEIYQEIADESLRLLYVALTRAKNYLMLTGKTPAKNKDKGFLKQIVEFVTNSDLKYERKEMFATKIISLTKKLDSSYRVVEKKVAVGKTSATKKEIDYRSGLQQEIKILLPHHKNTPLQKTEYSQNELSRITGTYIHKVLEHQVKKESQIDYTYWHMLAISAGITADTKKAWQRADNTVKAVLSSQMWRDIFRSCAWAKAEMPISCLENGRLINGVIDLLVCYPDKKLKLIDYKTGKEGSSSDVDAYRQQLFTYSKAVQKLYPNYDIEMAVLFTADCSLQPVS